MFPKHKFCFVSIFFCILLFSNITVINVSSQESNKKVWLYTWPVGVGNPWDKFVETYTRSIEMTMRQVAKKLNIEIYDFAIFYPDIPVCLATACPTGDIIFILVDEKDAEVLTKKYKFKVSPIPSPKRRWWRGLPPARAYLYDVQKNSKITEWVQKAELRVDSLLDVPIYIKSGCALEKAQKGKIFYVNCGLEAKTKTLVLKPGETQRIDQINISEEGTYYVYVQAYIGCDEIKFSNCNKGGCMSDACLTSVPIDEIHFSYCSMKK